MGNPFAPYHQANRAALEARGLDPHGEDDTVLGAFVHCHQHCRPHETGWCTVSLAEKTPLSAVDREAAYAEAKALGFYIDGEPWPCAHCGTSLITRGMSYKGFPTVDDVCSASPRGRHVMEDF